MVEWHVERADKGMLSSCVVTVGESVTLALTSQREGCPQDHGKSVVLANGFDICKLGIALTGVTWRTGRCTTCQIRSVCQWGSFKLDPQTQRPFSGQTSALVRRAPK